MEYKAWIKEMTPLVYDNSKSLYQILSEIIPILLNLKDEQNAFSSSMDDLREKFLNKVAELIELLKQNDKYFNDNYNTYKTTYINKKEEINTLIDNLQTDIENTINNIITTYQETYANTKQTITNDVNTSFTEIIILINTTYTSIMNKISNVLNNYFNEHDVMNMLYQDLITSDLDSEYKNKQITPWIEIKTYLPEATSYVNNGEVAGDIIYLGKYYHYNLGVPIGEIDVPLLAEVVDETTFNPIPFRPGMLYKYKNQLFTAKGHMITQDTYTLPNDGHEYYYQGYSQKDDAQVYWDETTKELLFVSLTTSERKKPNIGSKSFLSDNNTMLFVSSNDTYYANFFNSSNIVGDIYSSNDGIIWDIFYDPDDTQNTRLIYVNQLLNVLPNSSLMQFVDNEWKTIFYRPTSNQTVTAYDLFDITSDNDGATYYYVIVTVTSPAPYKYKYSLISTNEVITRENFATIEKNIIIDNISGNYQSNITHNGGYTIPFSTSDIHSYILLNGYLINGNFSKNIKLDSMKIFQTLNNTSVFLSSDINGTPQTAGQVISFPYNLDKDYKLYTGIFTGGESGSYFKYIGNTVKHFWCSPAMTQISTFQMYMYLDEVMV